MKQFILNNIKNIYGWKTQRKIIVISVDDYGNVRLDSKKARENMNRMGLKPFSPIFDNLDALETKEDLEILYETLTSVKDKNNNAAVFTPFALPCNINFEAMKEKRYSEYIYELLPDTYKKVSAINPKAYEGTWNLWLEGIEKRIMKPQSHGREHFNLRVFQENLNKKNKDVIIALENRSFTGIANHGDKFVKSSAAFDFFNFDENEKFEEIIEDGLNQFEKVFGYRATHFNPPGGREHSFIHKYLKNNGINYIDAPLIKKEHQGRGSNKRIFNYTGKKNDLDMIFQVRNVVFEPIIDWGFNWVDYSLKQVEAAFFWNRPAIISSHRVNFCGHIDTKNREVGIKALKELLNKIVLKWPDVEFMSADELGDLISKK